MSLFGDEIDPKYKNKEMLYFVRDPSTGKEGYAYYIDGKDMYSVFWKDNAEPVELEYEVLEFFAEPMLLEKALKIKAAMEGKIGGKRRVQKSRRRKLNKRKRTVRKHK